MGIYQNVVLILGNGFDLELGLPTKYSDFIAFTRFINSMIHNRVNEAISNLYNYQNSPKDTLRKITQKYIDVIFGGQKSTELSYIKTRDFDVYDETYTKRAVNEFTKWLELIQNNMWFDYFWKKSNTMGGWIDFEADISELIEYLDLGRYDTNGRPNSIDTEVPEETRTKIKLLTNQTLAINRHTTYRNIKDTALKDLNRLTEALSLYMKEEIETIELPQSSLRTFLFTALDECINAKRINVLDFNYTMTFERLVNVLYSIHISPEIVCHIHGIDGYDQSKGNIVLGIDEYLNDEQLQRNVDFTAFKKYYQRIDKETDSKYLHWINEMNNGGDIKIIIIGHSLGLTDGDVLRQLLNCQNVKAVDCYYHSPEARQQQISNLAGILGKNQLIQRITGPNKDIRLISQ